MYTPEKIYYSKANYHIVLPEDIMEDDVELRQDIKKIIVGLLKDRIEVDNFPDSKRVRTKKFIKLLLIMGRPMYEKIDPPAITSVEDVEKLGIKELKVFI
ncbi:hypothetical protein C1645_821106 [Glomus cerebriforme]|uniref:Uncharacterized protein n=1 Tax=Glomus cerebriforme TaxID=658196 RepID=A0A397TB38_9GLOM|nr:hypothetical protein C1645_821106 [Glomus cerebriforme]